MPKRRTEVATSRCIITRKIAVLDCFAAEGCLSYLILYEGKGKGKAVAQRDAAS